MKKKETKRKGNMKYIKIGDLSRKRKKGSDNHFALVSNFYSHSAEDSFVYSSSYTSRQQQESK